MSDTKMKRIILINTSQGGRNFRKFVDGQWVPDEDRNASPHQSLKEIRQDFKNVAEQLVAKGYVPDFIAFGGNCASIEEGYRFRDLFNDLTDRSLYCHEVGVNGSTRKLLESFKSVVVPYYPDADCALVLVSAGDFDEIVTHPGMNIREYSYDTAFLGAAVFEKEVSTWSNFYGAKYIDSFRPAQRQP